MTNQTYIDIRTRDIESATVQLNERNSNGVSLPEPAAPVAKETFDERVHRIYSELRSAPGPYQPISRRRLARLLGCSTERIRAIEDRFILKLKPVLSEYADAPFRQAVLNR